MTVSAQVLSFVPDVLDLALYAGDGVAIELTFADPDSGDPIDVTGDHQAQIRYSRKSTHVVAEFAFDDSNAAVGVLIVSLTAAQTSVMGSSFNGVWDLQWTAPGAEPFTLVQGKVTSIADVTRP